MARKNVKSLVPTKYNLLGFNVEHRKLIPNYCHLNIQLTLTKSIYIYWYSRMQAHVLQNSTAQLC